MTVGKRFTFLPASHICQRCWPSLQVFFSEASVVQDAQVTRHDLVLQHSPGRDVDPVAVVGDDDDRSLGNIGIK